MPARLAFSSMPPSSSRHGGPMGPTSRAREIIREPARAWRCADRGRVTKRRRRSRNWTILPRRRAGRRRAEPLLDSEVFETQSTFDALNRIVTHTAPASDALSNAPSVTRYEYNEASLLETVYVSARGGREESLASSLARCACVCCRCAISSYYRVGGDMISLTAGGRRWIRLQCELYLGQIDTEVSDSCECSGQAVSGDSV